MKRIVWILLAAALALVSCQKHERASLRTPGEVRFTTSLDRYSVKATDTAFEAGDQVGIFAGAPISVENVKASVSGSSLTPETAIRWVEDDNSVVSFYAYYPYASGAVKAYPFEVAADQSAIANYKKSDLMVAAAKSAPTEDAVALNFHHALSKVAITIDNQIANTTVSKLEFCGVALGAAVDLETGAVSGVSSEKKDVVANATGSGWQLLIVPQTAQPEVRVTLSSGANYLFKLDNAFTFSAGKKATANLVVKEAAAVTFTFEVVDWDDEPSPIDFGEGEEIGQAWSVVGLGGDWDLGIPMTCTQAGNAELEGVWEADITYVSGDEFKLRCGDLWAGMKENWAYYGTGEFEDGYLDATDAGKNIVLMEEGEFHLMFEWPSCRFVITKTGDIPAPQPLGDWKVMGLGGDWDNGVAMSQTQQGEEAGAGVWEADITYAEGDEFKLRSGEDGNYVWAGMKADWTYYGTGAFDDGYLDASDAGKNIVLEGAGEYHLSFEWPSCRFVVTKVGDEPVTPPEPETTEWRVRGLGGDWSWENAIPMTKTSPEGAKEEVWEVDITYAENDEFKICNKDGDDATWCGLQSGWTYYGLGDFDDAYLATTPGGPNIKIGKGDDAIGVAGKYHLVFSYPSLHFVITEVAAE